jgi:hypothetical protein
MPTLTKELLSFTKKGSKSLFDLLHFNSVPVLLQPQIGDAISSALEGFLTATLDEVRLRHAQTSGRNLLSLTDIDDADYFRQGLLRREISGDISYAKQRDHSAHTLYNYLLGWYVFSKSTILRLEMEKHFALRSFAKDTDRNFLMLWPIVSIVHDIGYLFEGSNAPLTPSVQNKQVELGAEVVQDYFHHQFWIECKVDSMHDRARLRSLAGVEEPDFSLRSMTSIADSLRLLGSLQSLQQQVLHEVKQTNYPNCSWDCLNRKLPEDAFDLWERHYSFLKLDSMVERIATLRKFFEYEMTSGFNGTGLRMLDHGVCSGLLLLLYSTFYFRMHAGLETKKPFTDDDEKLHKAFVERTLPAGVSYNPSWWWNGIVWATSAAGLHNFMQVPHLKPLPYESPKPLRIDEDPLAYLGILVDILQEWDRYTVSPESAIGGVLPLQGIDVELNSTGKSGVTIKFRDNFFRDRVKKALTESLADWPQVIAVN